MRWLLKYNGKSCAWYVCTAFIYTLPATLFIDQTIQYIFPRQSISPFVKYGSIQNAIWGAVIWAPFIETFIILIILYLSIFTAHALSEVVSPWKSFFTKQRNIIAASTCGVLAFFLHSHSADWGVTGAISFTIFSFLYFTLLEKSFLAATLSIMILHMMLNASGILLMIIFNYLL